MPPVFFRLLDNGGRGRRLGITKQRTPVFQHVRHQVSAEKPGEGNDSCLHLCDEREVVVLFHFDRLGAQQRGVSRGDFCKQTELNKRDRGDALSEPWLARRRARNQRRGAIAGSGTVGAPSDRSKQRTANYGFCPAAITGYGIVPPRMLLNHWGASAAMPAINRGGIHTMAPAPALNIRHIQGSSLAGLDKWFPKLLVHRLLARSDAKVCQEVARGASRFDAQAAGTDRDTSSWS